MKEGKRFQIFLKNDNRGASLLIVLGMFVMLTVVAANMLMLVNAGNVETAEEYETQQTFLTVSSVYEVLDELMRDNTWSDALLTDTDADGKPIPNQITVSGFTDENDVGIDVTIEVVLNKNLLTADYHIGLTASGESYSITAKYLCYGTGDERTITLKECGEMILE